MDSLKEGMHLRGYAQTDPLVEYQRESYEMFSAMVAGVKEGVVETVFHARPAQRREQRAVFTPAAQSFVHNEFSALKKDEGEKAAPVTAQRVVPKVGRNDLCPCGSGKKYKKCCGK